MVLQHTLKPFDRDLQDVHNKIVTMSEMVRKELSDCMQAFTNRDQQGSSDTVKADVHINASEREIDNLVVKIIVLHQPMASDCRQLLAALRISKDLERMGDYATNIANHSSTLDQLDLTGEEQRTIEMGNTVLSMLEKLITAYIDLDKDAAENIRQLDEAVDNIYTEIFANLMTISKGNSELTSACTHLVFIARSLERIGDHITDIAEEILFIINGEFPDDERIKADGSSFVKS